MNFLLKFTTRTPPLWVWIASFGMLAGSIVLYVSEVEYFEKASYSQSGQNALARQFEDTTVLFDFFKVISVAAIANKVRGRSAL